VRALTQEIGAERLVEISGSPVATGFQAATLRWLREREPVRFARIATVLAPKDWLRLQLTGVMAADAGDGSGALLLDVRARDWSPTLLAAVGIAHSKLPPVQHATSVAGGLLPAAAEVLGLQAGTPVVVGSADTACGMLGAGAVGNDTLIVNLSTGGQLVRPAPQPIVDTRGRMHTFCSALEPGPDHAGWYQMGATLNVGMALRWLRANVLGWEGGDAYERMTALAADAPPGAGGLLFLPYLVGERTPLLDPAARAAFLGLTAAHGQPHLIRAVLEGATFACYDAYHVLMEVDAEGAGSPQRVVLAGGGARSALWRQIVADIFGVSVRRLLVTEQSALGAALLAGHGAGFFDAVEAARAWVRLGEPQPPDPSHHQRYGELFALYQQGYAANRELMHKLGAW
jgi:xylulokinase